MWVSGPCVYAFVIIQQRGLGLCLCEKTSKKKRREKCEKQQQIDNPAALFPAPTSHANSAFSHNSTVGSP